MSCATGLAPEDRREATSGAATRQTVAAQLTRALDRAHALVHGDPARAEALAHTCAAAARKLGARPIAARAHYLLAQIHAERGRLDCALELLETARREWRDAGDVVASLRTHLGHMQLLDDLGRHREAAAVGEALLDSLDSLEHPDDPLIGWLRASALGNIGVSYGFVGEHERALEAYALSEAGYRALGRLEETAKPLANRGIELLELGRAREALTDLQTASRTFAAQGDRLWQAKCDVHVAHAHLALGDVVNALRVLDPARSALDDLGATAEAARARVRMAGAYLAAGLHGDAAAHARSAAAATAQAGLLHDTAVATFTAALAELALGRLDAADDDLRAAGELFAQVLDPQYQARVVLAQADLAAARGQRAEAARLATRAGEALRAGGWRLPLAWALLRRVDLTVDVDAAGAAACIDEAAELAERLGVPQLDHACELRRAQLARRRGDLGEAERRLRAAIAIVDHEAGKLPDWSLRSAFRADRLAAHDALVELLVAGSDRQLAEASRIADRAKARTLLDLVTGTGARGAAGGRLERRQIDLSAAHEALLAAREPSRRTLLQRRVADLERDIGAERLRLAVAGRGRALGDGTDGPPEDPLGAPTLAYHVCGDDVVAFFAADGELTARRIRGAVAAVEAELAGLASQWSRFRLGPAFARRHAAALRAATLETLQALHAAVFAPVEDLVAAAAGEDLVVVPHRQLHQVPFHALHDGRAFLAERWAVALSPAMYPTAPPRPRGRGAVVIAAADGHAPAVAAEARALAALMPEAETAVDLEATSALLRSRVPGPALVHIACHGLYRPDNPLFSALRLSDRWVTAAEVLDLDLGGALVILSACESGRPDLSAAEPVGLAWAFLAAGASGAVVSQWVVDDEVTAALMSRLYERLTAGDPPHRALRHAQLDTAAEHPHPYFWAPFTYVGFRGTPRKGESE